jgi:IS30 family transposase
MSVPPQAEVSTKDLPPFKETISNELRQAATLRIEPLLNHLPRKSSGYRTADEVIRKARGALGG